MRCKSLFLLSTILGVAFTGLVKDGSAAVIVQYSMQNNTSSNSPTTVAANVDGAGATSATNITPVSLAFFTANYEAGQGPGGACNAGTWSFPTLRARSAATTAAAAVTAGDYFTFTVFANSGFALNLSGQTVTFKLGADSGNPDGYELRSSVDNFGSDLLDGQSSGACNPTTVTVTLPSNGIYNGLSSVTFRMYVWDTAGGFYTDFDDITVNGAVVTSCTPPSQFTVSGGGLLCTVGSSQTITLSGSSNAATAYLLQLGGVYTGITSNGTGSALNFTGISTAGVYTVLASNTTTACTALMTGSATNTAITLSPLSLPGGTSGVAYVSTIINATNGTAPYSFAVTSGSLPSGLTFSSSTTTSVTLSGTPTAAGSFPVTITATDHVGCVGSQAYTINILGGVLVEYDFTTAGTFTNPTTVAVNVDGTGAGAGTNITTAGTVAISQFTSTPPPSATSPSLKCLTGNSLDNSLVFSTNTANNEYFTFKVYPNTGFLLNLSGQSITLSNGQAGADNNTGWALESSVDGFSTVLFTTNLNSVTPGAWAPMTVTLPTSASWNNLTNITFRFYFFTDASGTADFFNHIAVRGSTVASCTPPTATVSLTGSSSICSGQTTTVQAALTGTQPWTVTWLDGAGGTNFTQSGVTSSPATRTVTPASTRTYTVTAVTDNTGCAGGTSSGSAAVTVNPLPSSAITPPSAVCANSTGNTASVPSAGAGAGYAWSITAGSITAGSGSNVVTFTGAASGSFTLTASVTNSSGCSSTSSTNLSITANVAIQTQPANTSVCSGSNATFNVAATGVTAYQWLKGVTTLSNNSTISGATSATLTLTGVGTGDSGGSFSCQLTECGGATTNTSAATLTVNASNPVSVSIGASPSTTNCVNTLVTFTATPTNGGSTPIYQWKKNGNNVGSNSSTYIDSALTNNDVISCVLTSNISCPTGNPVTSPSLTMTVTPAPSITVQPSSVSNVSTGSTVSFIASVTNATTYQWQISTNSGANFNNVASGGTATNYTTPAVASTDDGNQYRLIASGTCSPSATSSVATLTIARSLISRYSFATSTLNVSTNAANVTASAITGSNLGNLSASSTTGPGGTPAVTVQSSSSTASDAVANNRYFSYTNSANSGFVLNLSGGSVTFSNAQLGADANTGWALHSSVDNFTTAIMSSNLNSVGADQWANITVPLPVSTSWNKLSSITFRMYIFAPAPGVQQFFGAVALNGFVAVDCRPVAAVRNADSTTICSNATATIHADLTGTTPWNVTWLDGAGGTNFTQTVSTTPATRAVSPLATTTYTITAITDAGGCGAGTSSGSATVTVNPLPVITTASLPNGTAGTSYNQKIVSTGTAPVTYSVTSGSLPTGLSLSSASSTGTVSGTPTVTGTFNFTVTATDGSTTHCTGSQAYSVTIGCGTITVLPATLLNVAIGVPYNQTVTASGAIGSTTFGLTGGALPTGLSLSSGGLISGTYNGSPGSATFTITATDANSCKGSNVYTVSMVSCSAITLSPPSLPGGTDTVAYSQTITASGGSSPYTFSVFSGALPTGLSLSSAGKLSGTPSAAGTYNFTVAASDSIGCPGTQPYSVVISCPTITVSGATSNGTLGVAYPSITNSASGGTSPYTFSISSGALPAGLTLNSANGVISGTPLVGGSFTYVVRATDSHGCTGDSVSHNITIACTTITISPSSLSTGFTGTAYSQTFTATGGGSNNFTVSSGTLPSGLTLTATNGSLSGTPTTAGNSSFTIQATAGSCTGSQAYVLSIISPPTPPSITTQPTAQSGCSGTTASFNVAASGSTPLSYAWLKSPGLGWGTNAWVFNPNVSAGPSGYYIGSSTNGSGCVSGPSTPGIDSAGQSFAIYANNGGFASASRSFTSLAVGQSISLDFQNRDLVGNNAAQTYFQLRDASGSSRFEFQNAFTQGVGQSNNYTIIDSGTTNAILLTKGGMHIVFTLVTADTYNLTVFPLGGTTLYTFGGRTLGGTSGNAISQILFFLENVGSGNRCQDLFFNNIVVGSGFYDNASNYAVNAPGTTTGTWINNTTAGNLGSPLLANGTTVSNSTISGATTTNLQISNTSTADATNYNVVVYNTYGSVLSSAAALTVNTAPSVTSSPNNATKCEGDSVTFSVVASGSGLTYQWRKNTASISGATSSSYAIASVVSGDAGSYDCVVSGTCSPSATSSAATLMVNTGCVPDSWLTSHGYTTGTSSATVGSNGVTLLYSYLAGLNPTNVTSKLDMASASVTPAGLMTVTWLSQQDGTTPVRLYDFYSLTAPYTNGALWSRVDSNIPPAGATTSVSDDASGVTQRFYRVTIAGHTGDVATVGIAGVQMLMLAEGANYISMSTTQTTPTLLSVLGTNQLPQGAVESTATTVDIWDQTSQAFLVNNARYWLSTGANGWKQHNTAAASNNVQLDPTKGFIVTIRAGQGSQTLYVPGFVPMGAEAQTVQANGYTVASSTYPQPVTLTESGISNAITGGISLSRSDNVLFFDPTTQLFDIRVWYYTGDDTWRNADTSLATQEFQPGEAFLIQRRSRITNLFWTNPVPYQVPLQGP